jgi:mono/diheme cytochrome c family protein
MKWLKLAVLTSIVVGIGGAWLALSLFSLSARGGPGPTETYLATKAKRFLVSRDARGLTVPPVGEADAVRGFSLFAGNCAHCHGLRGRQPTAVGLALYPPTPALDSPQVQSYSEAELFWIAKNGIRLTGMPTFAGIHTDEELWAIVRYIRSLGEGQTTSGS